MKVNLDSETVTEIDSALAELLRVYADTAEFDKRVRVRRAMSKFRQACLNGTP